MTLSEYFIAGLGLVFGFSWLIFVHELGHYLVAKWNGVRVHVFSLGMGPYILSYRRGETLYVLSLVPIGGYVKMAGQDDLKPSLEPTRDPRDYRNKKPGRRAAILAAGAAFNLLFAYLAFALCYYVGVEMDAAVIGEVTPGTPLARAQEYDSSGRLQPAPLQKGDVITMINGEPVKCQLEITLAVASAGSDRDITIDYLRGDRPARTPALVHTQKDPELGAATLGLEPYQKEERLRIGIEADEAVYVRGTTAGSAAEAAGLQRGDRVVSLDGQRIQRASQIVGAVEAAKGRPQELAIEREGAPMTVTLAGQWNPTSQRYLIGMEMARIYRVMRIDPECEAYGAGVREGDVITVVHKLRNGREVALAFGRMGKGEPADVKMARVPLETRCASPLFFGIQVPETKLIKYDTAGEAFAVAWTDLWRNSLTVFVIIKRLFTRDVSFKAMSGPYGIGKLMTNVAVERPLMFYFWILALLSLNLGVLQIVPIPLLDGFHLVMLGVEKLKGTPVPLKVQEAFQYVGLVLILALLIFVTFNDIMRK